MAMGLPDQREPSAETGGNPVGRSNRSSEDWSCHALISVPRH